MLLRAFLRVTQRLIHVEIVAQKKHHFHPRKKQK